MKTEEEKWSYWIPVEGKKMQCFHCKEIVDFGKEVFLFKCPKCNIEMMGMQVAVSKKE